MKELVTPLLACALLASPMAATAEEETMSCFVAIPGHAGEFTPDHCAAVFCGASGSAAVFRVDPPLPNNFEVRWSDTICDSTRSTCRVGIRAFEFKTMRALVLDLDNDSFFEVSATANFENCQ